MIRRRIKEPTPSQQQPIPDPHPHGFTSDGSVPSCRQWTAMGFVCLGVCILLLKDASPAVHTILGIASLGVAILVWNGHETAVAWASLVRYVSAKNAQKDEVDPGSVSIPIDLEDGANHPPPPRVGVDWHDLRARTVPIPSTGSNSRVDKASRTDAKEN